MYYIHQLRTNSYSIRKWCYILQEIVTPDVLYDEVIEVEERVVLQQERCEIKQDCPVVTGTTNEKARCHHSLIELKRDCLLCLYLGK